jgi:UDP-N-acetylglucosamine 4,6-dehydratase/5-epimerase
MLEGKSFLITGGTGSFGHTLVNRLLASEIAEIVIFSRDEAKQHFMKQKLSDGRLRFILGDVRNYESIARALRGVDYVFHAAALKQVPASESFPWEFVQTNIQGSHNLLRAISESKVTNSVFLSTDKAVYPLNAMGMSKALMEKLVRSDEYSSTSTSVITRYGNVIGSRGSVIPQFIDSIKEQGFVSITDLSMTRFMMSLEESVELVLFALGNGENGDLFVQKSPAASVEVIVDALSLLLNRSDVEIRRIGIRPGEKIHETLLTAEERSLAIEHEKYFQVRKRTGVLTDTPVVSNPNNLEYTSANTYNLTTEELAELLKKIPMVASLLR